MAKYKNKANIFAGECISTIAKNEGISVELVELKISNLDICSYKSVENFG